MKKNIPIDIDGLLENVFSFVGKTIKNSTGILSDSDTIVKYRIKDENREEMNKDFAEESGGNYKDSVFNEMKQLFNEEIVTLFKDWFGQVAVEINTFLEKNKDADPKQIAKEFQISENSVKIFLKAIKNKKDK